MPIKRGRQMGKSLSQIRDDHVNRYYAAAEIGCEFSCESAADVGCGFGYGSWILAKAGIPWVRAYDSDADEVFPFARQYWDLPQISWIPLARGDVPPAADLLVMFEVLEHFHCEDFLRRAAAKFPLFIGSVPNESVVPFGPDVHKDHVRHYTPKQLVKVLGDNGWEVDRLGSQLGKRQSAAKIRWHDTRGRTLLFVARAK